MSVLDHATQRDTAFSAYIKQFEGTCRNFVKYGHKSESCPEKKLKAARPNDVNQPSLGRFNGKCQYCGSYSHKKVDSKKNCAEIA